MKYYLIFIAVMSLVAFSLYGIDKQKARNGEWRISEKALLLASLFGGAVGGFLAMQLFRHKTRHWYFTAVNLFGIALHVTLFFVIWTVL